MEYAVARREGLPIGSGNVEATCKSLVSESEYHTLAGTVRVMRTVYRKTVRNGDTLDPVSVRASAERNLASVSGAVLCSSAPR